MYMATLNNSIGLGRKIITFTKTIPSSSEEGNFKFIILIAQAIRQQFYNP